MYVRQNPNAKWFSLIKTQLYVYNLSGRDSTKWGNKFLRRIGDAPVIYNEEEAQRSEEEITKAVHNMGYMAATVKRSTKIKKKKIKMMIIKKMTTSLIMTNQIKMMIKMMILATMGMK